MIFICSFMVLFIFFCVFMFLVAGGFIVFSGDGQTPQATPQKPITQPKQKTPKAQQRTFIDLNGTLIELFTKAEITQAKKDGYKLVTR